MCEPEIQFVSRLCQSGRVSMLLKAADKPGFPSCSGSCSLGLQQGQHHTREQDAFYKSYYREVQL